MQIGTIVREFSYNGVTLPDPGAHLTPESVRDMYSAAYPEITTASVEGPERKGDKICYVFKRAVGTKGAMPLYLGQESDGLTYVKVAPSGTPKSVVARVIKRVEKEKDDFLDRLAFFCDNILFR